jgi:bifunctional non-homologous end joining protein LigD
MQAAAQAGIQRGLAKRADAPYEAGAAQSWVELQAAPPGTPPEKAASNKRAARAPRPSVTRVKLTNLEKVYWPAEGFTKGELVSWYDSVADVLLPYLHDRPVHMNRFPDGIDGKSFYQRQAKEDTPSWVTTVPIDSGTHGSTIPQILCNDRDTLLWMANSGSIDLHPWLSRWGSLESPDWAVLDLDPKGAPFRDVVRIAREIGKLLFGIGLRPLVKTSGKTGLHVYVPLVPGYGYEQARMFCEGVARLVVRDLSAIATVERAIESREGKVYVDFGQNRRGQTVVPPYSVRPVRGATVSTPLSWDELDGDLTPARFTIQTVGERLARLGDLFRPALSDRQDLLQAIEALQGHLGRSAGGAGKER